MHYNSSNMFVAEIFERIALIAHLHTYIYENTTKHVTQQPFGWYVLQDARCVHNIGGVNKVASGLLDRQWWDATDNAARDHNLYGIWVSLVKCAGMLGNHCLNSLVITFTELEYGGPRCQYACFCTCFCGAVRTTLPMQGFLDRCVTTKLICTCTLCFVGSMCVHRILQ